jgi:hypothetical protein
MATVIVKILEPKARRLLDDLESLKLIQIETKEKKVCQSAALADERFGCLNSRGF